jgi:hypothetical protein
VQTGIKRALLKVSGFDYVPENLRSNTYKKAAQAVLVTHRSMNNFHHEPIPTRRLAQLGSTIPLAAFAECMQAYLSVYLGNAFGHSWGAQPIAEKELCKLPTNRWELYLSKILPQDEEILFKLTESKPASNFCDLVILKSIDELDIGNTFVERLVKYAAKKKTSELEKVARGMLEKMRNS